MSGSQKEHVLTYLHESLQVLKRFSVNIQHVIAVCKGLGSFVLGLTDKSEGM